MSITALCRMSAKGLASISLDLAAAGEFKGRGVGRVIRQKNGGRKMGGKEYAGKKILHAKAQRQGRSVAAFPSRVLRLGVRSAPIASR